MKAAARNPKLQIPDSKPQGTSKRRNSKTTPGRGQRFFVFSCLFFFLRIWCFESGIFVTAGQCQEPGAKSQELPQTVLLDPSAYWHYYLHGGPMKINAELLKSDGEKLLGKKYKELERSVQAALKKKGQPADNWWNEVHYPIGYWNLERLQDAATSAPPADFSKVEFDDSDWSCYRKPFKMGKDFFWDGFTNPTLQIRTVYFRSSFELPDPDKAGELTLRLVYRGGVCAYLNGQEIARGHLPPGPLSAGTLAEIYPVEAYQLPEEDRPKDAKHHSGGSGGLVPELTLYTDRPDQYDALKNPYEADGKSYRQAKASGYSGRCWLTREAWERVRNLRDRVAEVKIPAKLLRKGTNVLALEVHSGQLHPLALVWKVDWEGDYCWEHGWLLDVCLKTAGEGLPATLQRPAGVQVWPVDIHHRLYSPEFQPPPLTLPSPQGGEGGVRGARLRVVGAKNGTYGAQVAIGTDHELSELKASVSDFSGAGGKLPASIVEVLYGVPLPERQLRTAGWSKGDNVAPGLTRVNSEVVLDRFSKYAATHAVSRGTWGEGAIDPQAQKRQEEEIQRIQFFDQLSPRPPGRVPADTCQAVWFSVRIGRAAAPGVYSARVRIEATGMSSVEMPLELEVADWCLPDSRDFQAIIALEQSPYAVARQYKVEPWSEEHFKRVEKSMQLLGRVGNDFLGIPVVCRTELGNGNDSPIRITRKKDGSLAFDFTRADRYIDMALKYWGEPWCICFVVDHPNKVPYQQLLPVMDEAGGEAQYVQIGPAAPAELRRGAWSAVARAIAEHMRARGLLQRTYWGLHGDEVNDSSLLPLLREFVPEVKWARYSHQSKCDEFYAFCANVRCAYFYAIASQKGWKALTGPANCWLPRHWNSIAVTEGVSAPPSFRIGLERALVAGCPGMARVGADYWLATWLNGTPMHPYAGMPISSVLWPGEDGAESSVRFEMLCEGAQETEARIFLEQAMEVEKLNDPEMSKRVTEMLDRRVLDTIFALPTAPHLKIEEYLSGWQVRSRQLYQAAAEVAAKLGVDLNRSQLTAKIPARGQTKVDLILRNWSSQERAYKLSSEQTWIKLPAPVGRDGISPYERRAKLGFQPLAVTLDAGTLDPGKPAEGTVVLTDVATGRAEQVQIAAQVSDVLQLTAQSMSVNLPPGGSCRHPLTLLNGSGAETDYAIAVSASWVKAEPAKGKLAAGASCPVTLVVTPPLTLPSPPGGEGRVRGTGGLYEAVVQVSESGGARVERKLAVHVVPEYQPPPGLPAGQPVALETVLKEKGCLKSCRLGGKDKPEQRPSFHRTEKGNAGEPIGQKRNEKKEVVPVKRFEQAMTVKVAGDIVLNIEGRGFSAFSAEVGPHFDCRLGQGLPWKPKLHFEGYVDGKFAGHSGPMQLGEGPRLLVITGLKDAKELRLVTRVDLDENFSEAMSVSGVWGKPELYK